MSSKSSRLAASAVIAVAALATSSCALGLDLFETGPGYGQSRDARYEFDQGYRDGLHEGERDVRRGERFDVRDERGWQRASSRAYRDGFEQGYERGYRGRGSYGGYGDGRYGRNDDRYGEPRGNSRYANPAAEAGFRDGLEAGRDDARDGDRYDPVRSKKYRSADHDYDRRYGTREQWKVDYREGFKAGYDRGYRWE